MMHNSILVSICCITYNHEKFIRDAIEGFLMQKTTFAIEILIHDDASTDRTADIIREYEKKYHDLIKPIYQKENQYSKGVKIFSTFQFPRARGKYIAMCEGDDYWTDPYKLQKQVDFLEANEDYILCFTNCKGIDEDGNSLKENRVENQDEATYTHSDMPIFAPTLTRVFRNEHLNTIPQSFNDAFGGDTYLLVWQSKFGKIKFQNYNSSIYRLHGGGVWSSRNNFQKAYHSFQTRFAILDILENGMKEKFLYLLSGILRSMRKRSNSEAESLVCKDLYHRLSNYSKNEKDLKRISLFRYLRFKVHMILRYHIYNVFTKLHTKIRKKLFARQP